VIVLYIIRIKLPSELKETTLSEIHIGRSTMSVRTNTGALLAASIFYVLVYVWGDHAFTVLDFQYWYSIGAVLSTNEGAVPHSVKLQHCI